jgi:hypothetical protein
VIHLKKMAQRKARSTARAAHVGDRVSVRMGTYTAVGTVVEDRGAIGVNGRRLLRVEVKVERDVEPVAIEVPATDAHIVAA